MIEYLIQGCAGNSARMNFHLYSSHAADSIFGHNAGRDNRMRINQ